MEDKIRELLSQRRRNIIKDEHLKPSAVLLPLFIKNGGYHILFIKRSQEVEDHKGEISFPGGLWEKGDERLEKTALREAFEETNLQVRELRQFRVYSEPGRDPRFHTLTVVFIASAQGEVRAGDDASEARWFALDNLPKDIAFDHAEVIADAHRAGLIG